MEGFHYSMILIPIRIYIYITKIIMLILTFTHTFSGKKPYSKRTRDQLGLFMKSSETSFMDSPFVLPLEASVC